MLVLPLTRIASGGVVKETALQREDEGVLVFSGSLVRSDSGAKDAASLVMQNLRDPRSFILSKAGI